MKKKILVVEDDQVFRNSLVRALKLEGFDVFESGDGIEALESLKEESVDLVLSDIRMPKLHGIEVLHRVKRSFNIPVILMSGFSEIIDVQEAVEIGAANFLAKPFRNEDLISAVNMALNLNTQEQVHSKDLKGEQIPEYCKIDIENFDNGSQFKIPIFLKLKSGKYIKISHQGEDLSDGQIKRFLDKGLKYLFFKSDDYYNYVTKLNELKNIIYEDPKIPKGKKLDFVKTSLEVVSQFGFDQYFDREVFEYTQQTLEQMLHLLGSSSSTYRALNAINDYSPSLYSHSLCTAFISLALCKSNSWHSHSTQLNIATGALFHDIGKCQIDKKYLDIPIVSLSGTESRQYQSHVKLGIEKLKSFNITNENILQIVEQHHEACDGSGYPEGLSKIKTYPPARIVGLANDFARYFQGFGGVEKIRPIRKIVELLEVDKNKYDPDQIELLRNLAKNFQ